jgi:hypothetical protein
MDRKEEIAQAVARAKREILEDIECGLVPSGVASFSELHDFVDANWYGGAFELTVDEINKEKVAIRN